MLLQVVHKRPFSEEEGEEEEKEEKEEEEELMRSGRAIAIRPRTPPKRQEWQGASQSRKRPSIFPCSGLW